MKNIYRRLIEWAVAHVILKFNAETNRLRLEVADEIIRLHNDARLDRAELAAELQKIHEAIRYLDASKRDSPNFRGLKPSILKEGL